jgi:hypothetical protein
VAPAHDHDSSLPDTAPLHFYEHGDIYDALDALDDLRLVLGRLKRLGRLANDEVVLLNDNLAAIQAVLDSKIAGGGTPGVAS